MIRVIILDDEKPALLELEYLLKKESEIEVVGTYTDPVKAIEDIEIVNPDAIFLDIDMPVINGLNVAREIVSMGKKVEIVFITAFNEYAVKAFEVNAIDYILKPIVKDRLDKAIDRLKAIQKKKTDAKTAIMEKISTLETYIKHRPDKIIAWNNEEIILLKRDDVLFFETDSGNTFAVSRQGKFRCKECLDALEDRLKDVGFFRCHRSFIVNLKHVVKISPMFNNYIIKLEGDLFDVPVSRNNIKRLKDILGIT
ncbi:MAG: LytTR family DNA-binding domain-containing protein [Clostridia bacterium]|nr:LytTR family DNA-binding domain-containing protein [Clostridia bacterium]